MLTNKPYDFEEHVHRFAIWAASRAASVVGQRFPVRDGRRIIEAVGLRNLIGMRGFPEPSQFDHHHLAWREEVITRADFPFELSHGVAAKLINCYLKAAVVLASNSRAANDPRVAAIHPPVDRLLLSSIRKNCGGATARLPETPWSKFNSSEYQATIEALKEIAGNRPLWTVEEHWRGHH